jgi:quercetin dioxygenase-like cupin family protein
VVKITKLTDALEGGAMEPQHFTGPTTSHPLLRTTEPHPVTVAVVRFSAGSRNHWHRHAGGQLLHVVEGEGWVQSRGTAAERIHTGDSISAAPGEEHWHGAGEEGAMAHIAVTVGETTFLEPSDGPDPTGS